MKKITFKFSDICRKVFGTLAVVVIFLMPASRSVLGEVANKGTKFPGQKSLLQAHGEQQEQMRGGRNQNDSDSSNSASCPSTGSAISPVRNSSGGSSSNSGSGSSRMLNNRPAAK